MNQDTQVPQALPRPSKPTTDEVQSALKRNRWIEAKKDLLSRPAFAERLKPFEGDLAVDAIVFDATSKVMKQEPLFDPYQIESLISSVSTLLDRCLVYRRDMYDLEEQAIRRALEYKLFLDQYEAQLSIELAERAETQRQLEQQGQGNAYTAFSKEKAALPEGFGAIAQASSASLVEAIAAEKERKINVRLKFAA